VHSLRRAVVIGALGFVFGEIGTSPIYTFGECLKSSSNAGNVCFVVGAGRDLRLPKRFRDVIVPATAGALANVG
jgi:hypothetical protein